MQTAGVPKFSSPTVTHRWPSDVPAPVEFLKKVRPHTYFPPRHVIQRGLNLRFVGGEEASHGLDCAGAEQVDGFGPGARGPEKGLGWAWGMGLSLGWKRTGCAGCIEQGIFK
jgi:hypothetical protein